MNLEDLTLKQLKEAASLVNKNNGLESSMIGKYVVVRCLGAGVHTGLLVSCGNRECVVAESRRLWYFEIEKGKGDFLSAVALHGLSPESKLGEEVPEIFLTDVCEIIPCSRVAEASIRSLPIHNG